MRRITLEQRRACLVERHRLTGDAGGVAEVVGALLALHATDPTSVVLSVLARSRSSTAVDVTGAMSSRAFVRWLAMRRTLFVFARDDVPLIQAAVSSPLAVVLRRRLASRIERNGIEPPIDDVRGIEQEVEQAVRTRGSATGAELRGDVAGLRSVIPARTPSEATQALTSSLLTLMSAEGRIVRGIPVGTWTTRNHRWEPIAAWWPDGLPSLEPAAAQAELARRWLERFGPATVDDLRWWTGWTLGDARRALERLDVEEVDLHGGAGVDLRGRELAEPATPTACLLPALDPTPMGWRHREWFSAADPAPLYDRAGNIGPTIWWGGELIGAWASTPGGVRTRILADRGGAAREAVDAAAALLHERLAGVVVTPAARTPAERELSAG